MKKKFLIALATMAAMVCLFATSAFANDVLQTNHDVYMRTGPSTDYAVMYTLPAGTSVYFDHTENGWSCVTYNGDVGWVYSNYLGTNAPATSTVIGGINSYRITSDVNMRSGPSTSYGIYTVLPAGSTVTVESISNGWAYVYYGNYAGYVSTSYISSLGGTTTNTTNTTNSTKTYGTTWYNGSNYANVYDYNYYLANNRDLAAAIGTDPNAVISHFVNYGMNEGRQAISSFNVYAYRDQHPDLRSQFGDNLPLYYLYACGIPVI